MKALSLVLFTGILTLCTARPAPAVMTEYITTNRTVAVTNVLPTSEVRPVAAYILFPAPATGTVSISRVTRGVAVPLARHAFTNASALTWLPPADFPIRRGEAFAVSSTVARFTLQLESTTDGDTVQRTDAAEWYDEGRPFASAVAGGGSTQVTVTNAPQFVVTNHIVITNAVTVNTGGAGGPQFGVGLSGEYVATNALSMDTFGISGPNVSAVLDWDGVADFSGFFAVPAKLTGGTPTRPGEILFDAAQGSSGRFYGYRNDTWHAFVMDDEPGGAGGDFIPSLGPWVTTNSGGELLSFSGNGADSALIFSNPNWASSYLNLGLGSGSTEGGALSGGGLNGTHFSLQYDNLTLSQYNGIDVLLGTVTVDASGNLVLDDSLGAPLTLSTLRAAGSAGSYIPTLGPWATTNDFGAEFRFLGGTMSAKIEGTLSGGGAWWMDGGTLALAGNYNAGTANALIQMGATDEGDVTLALPSGSVVTFDDTFGSKASVIKGTYDDGGTAVAGFELSASKLTLRNNFNAGVNPVSIEVDSNGDIKFNDFANANLLLKNIVRWVTAPSAPTDPGVPGDAAYDSAYLYVCVAANSWVRTALSTW